MELECKKENLKTKTMKRLPFLILLLIGASSLYGQTTISLEYTGFRTEVTNSLTEAEMPRYSQRLLVGADWSLNKYIELSSGLGVFQTGFRTVSRFEGVSFGLETFKKIQHFHYLVVPTKVKLRFNKLSIAGGLTHNLNIGSRQITTQEYFDGSSRVNINRATFNSGEISRYLAVAELGIYFDVKKATIGVTALRSLTELIDNVPRENLLEGIGLHLGYKIRSKKKVDTPN